jgi:hypothetical protein
MIKEHEVICVDTKFVRLCEIIPRSELARMKIAHNGHEREVNEKDLPKDLMGRLVAVAYSDKLITLNHWSFGNPSEEHPSNYYLKAEYLSRKDEPDSRFYLVNPKTAEVIA